MVREGTNHGVAPSAEKTVKAVKEVLYAVK